MGLRFLSQTCTTRPLTRSQQLIWTGQRLQPAAPLYNMALAFTLKGEIDHAVFQEAFQHVVQASEAMRTTFEHHAGVARQRFHEQYLYDVELLDFSNSKSSESDAAQCLTDRTRICFDLNRCLFDSALLKLGDELYVWYFNQHHLVTDASSTALIYRAVAAEYQHRSSGQDIAPVRFPPFSDYVDYEQTQQTTKSNLRAQRYWQEKPKQAVPPSSFFTELPARRSGVTHRTPCELGESRIERIKHLAQSGQCTALTADLAQFQVFATALFSWLYRITGNSTLAFGMPTHNRGLAAHKSTPGLFIELYPLIVEVDEDDSFLDLYKKVAKNVQELLIHTGPGVSNFAINRDVQVVLNYITAEFGPFGDIPMSSEWIHPDSGDRNHLVRVQVENFDAANKWRVSFDLNDMAFPEAQRALPGQHFCALIDAFTSNPDQKIASANILEETQLGQLARGLEQLDTETVPMTTVLTAFAEQVRNAPDSVAVRWGDRQLSYRQLFNQASAFAAKLSQEGVGQGDRVAIVLPRSAEAVIAIWGTLIAGAAYVPVDTQYPESRRQFILTDADVKVVVTQPDDRSSGLAGISRLTLSVDDAAAPPDVSADINADSSAYIIYTSGSTGQPKGVEVLHGSLSNYVQWARSYYQPAGALRWPLFSSMAFDLTVTSLFVPLCSGGELVIYSERNDERDIAVRRVIEDNRVDIIKLTPAHLALLQAMDLSTSTLQSLVVGGEDFRTELARSVDNYFGGRVKLYNEYGPTEGTVACAVHCFEPGSDTSASVPIGKSVNGAHLYVLNSALELQPPGVVGELYIGGAGVAHGYFGNHALTAEKFVDNPFRPGEFMYRTGDLARARLDVEGEADGLMCLGRADHQLKVNGLRIEPGEIEQALLKMPQISESVVSLYTPDEPVPGSDEEFCVRCGISGRHPSAQLDDQDVCKICYVYEAETERARDYFGGADDLEAIVKEVRASSECRPAGAADCMMLLSGGKDSTYALCQVVDLGLKPLVFTLDNGFISQGAKDNMTRVVEHLGLELISASTPAMNAIFRDSLNRFSNVCNGCFKTIYTLSLQVAHERGIKHIFTGLSRGQIFETRVADLFRQGEFDIDRIDSMVIEARKAYHRADDAVSQSMDVSHFDDDAIFTDIKYVDYYRYADVSLDTILTYLKERVPWVRPADTGRSTNCLINEAGIFVHKQERGFHNYSLPYSWDVRLGHKERDAAREELDDNINIDNVNRILDEIEYTPRAAASARRRALLVAHYVASSELDTEVLKAHLRLQLPEGLVPTAFVQVDAMPLTPNGKVNRDALPSPAASRSHLAVHYEAPVGQVELLLVQAWQTVFGIERIGVNDNFFELGGDSIVNIQIVASVAKQGLLLSPQQIFDSPTIRELAAVAGTATELAGEQGPVTGDIDLTPIQHRFFSWNLASPSQYCQYVLLDSSVALDKYALQESLRQIIVHHDVLRARYVREAGSWRQVFGSADSVNNVLTETSMADLSGQERKLAVGGLVETLQGELDIGRGVVFRAVVIELDNGGCQLLMVAHHLVVDAVSWWILLDDLEDSYRALSEGKPVELPTKTSSMRHWSEVHKTFAAGDAAKRDLPMWQDAVSDVSPMADESVDASAMNSANENIDSCGFVLDAGLSRTLMTEVSANWRVQPQDLLITALVETVSAWTGNDTFTLDVEAHGRELISNEIDVLRTVGWFTSVFPLRVTCDSETSDLSGSLRRVRDTLRDIELGGVSYGALRYVDCDAACSRKLVPEQSIPAVFNYLGLWRKQRRGGLLQFAQPLAASYGNANQRPYEWEINAMFFDDCLQLTWDYSATRFSKQTMSTLAAQMRQRLRALVEHCAAVPDVQLTPQDFPNAGIDQSALDDLLADYGDL